MRIEQVHGRYLLCGNIIPKKEVRPGQTWAPADGSNRTVTVDNADDEWVDYSWTEDGVTKTHMKLNFSFQCRYCLVLDKPELPDWAK